jgi:hypothetical protein
MEQQCLEEMRKALTNWSTADVRTVPGVMYQIRCGDDENDPTIEYQINWFIDCTETYIHNHRHSFDTLCLEGGYTEKLWQVIDDQTGAVTFQFPRDPGNIFGVPQKIPGALCHIKTRDHFPGNQMHVGTDQFHSISSSAGSSNRVFTFLIKRKHTPTPNMYVLSSYSVIDEPTDEIRSATEEERHSMHEKLQQMFQIKSRQLNQ